MQLDSITPPPTTTTTTTTTSPPVLSSFAARHFREEVDCFFQDVNVEDLLLGNCFKVSHLRQQMEQQRGMNVGINFQGYLIGQNFGGQNFRRKIFFGTKSIFRQFCPTKFLHWFLISPYNSRGKGVLT